MAITMKAARLNAGYTQGQAADKIGVNKGTINAWENGKTSPTVWQWQDLCELYGMGFEDILIPKKFKETKPGATECPD